MKKLLIIALACLAQMQAWGQFYHPDKKEYQTPDQHGLKYESVTFESRDRTKLHGWYVPATGKAIGTILHFHGNAQNLTSHFSYVKWLPAQGFNVFLFDYRGYGASAGKPSRKGIHEDAIAAIRYVQSRDDVGHGRLLVFAQSLGGAIAISAIGSTDASGVCGIAVESTFDSYEAIAKEKAPDFIAALFTSDALSPQTVVADISPTPIVFIHGTADRVVPYARGKSLFDRAKNPKAMWTIQGGHHIQALTTYGTIYRPRLLAFFKQCLASSATDRPASWAQPIKLDGLPNLHQVSTNLYRSAQPTARGMQNLKHKGIETVVNLRSFHSDRDEIGETGLGYEHIYMKAWHPERKEVVRFLQIVTNPKRTPVLVHCQHGSDRTGTMCALYRIVVQGWSKEDAIREMTKGGFGFHGVFKNLPEWIKKLDIESLRKDVGIQTVTRAK